MKSLLPPATKIIRRFVIDPLLAICGRGLAAIELRRALLGLLLVFCASGQAFASGSIGSLVVSQGTFTDHVHLTWNVSQSCGFIDTMTLYRDGVIIDYPGVNSYDDYTAVPGVTYTYRVHGQWADIVNCFPD